MRISDVGEVKLGPDDAERPQSLLVPRPDRLVERLQRPDVEHLEEARLQTEHPGGADLETFVARGRLGEIATLLGLAADPVPDLMKKPRSFLQRVKRDNQAAIANAGVVLELVERRWKRQLGRFEPRLARGLFADPRQRALPRLGAGDALAQ